MNKYHCDGITDLIKGTFLMTHECTSRKTSHFLISFLLVPCVSGSSSLTGWTVGLSVRCSAVLLGSVTPMASSTSRQNAHGHKTVLL